jgi:hypothetical protein
MLLFIMKALLAKAGSGMPVPPRQSAQQARMMESIATLAMNYSDAATPSLLSALDNATCRVAFGTACSANRTRVLLPNSLSWGNVSASLTVQMLRETASNTEVLHAFNTADGMYGDPSLDDAVKLGFYLNLWQTAVLGLSKASVEKFAFEIPNSSEIVLYGAQSCKNASNCTWSEACGRITYTTIGSDRSSLARSAAPALEWGNISLLLRTSNPRSPSIDLREIMGLAPLDTGDFGYNCLLPGTLPHWPPFPPAPPSKNKCAKTSWWWPPGKPL